VDGGGIGGQAVEFRIGGQKSSNLKGKSAQNKHLNIVTKIRLSPEIAKRYLTGVQ
jgi:hypothetical protein